MSPVPPATARTDQYAGTWVRCFAFSSTQSDSEAFVFTKVSDTVLTSAYSATRYQNTTCTGAGTAQPGEQATLTLQGRSGAAANADKVLAQVTAPTPATIRTVLALSAEGLLQFGDRGRTLDAEGYPTLLTTQPAFRKQ